MNRKPIIKSSFAQPIDNGTAMRSIEVVGEKYKVDAMPPNL